MGSALRTDAVLAALRAAAEPTRLRILMLLAGGELNVKDLTQVLGQSQPRISRHLKLLSQAGLVQRFREGSWVYFHLADDDASGRLARFILESVDQTDPQLMRDRARGETVKRAREASAQDYFQAHAAQWDRIRSAYAADSEVEAAMVSALGPGPFELLVDLGTGTGRMLELFAGRTGRGLGIDLNQAMLAYARGKLARAGLGHCQVRHGDLYNLALADDVADGVVMHQVLHFLSDPARAIFEAARVLAPGGRLLIVDFAPHEMEKLRDDFAHERLGFATEQVAQWMSEAGLCVRDTHNLAPGPGSGDKLTVSLWLGLREGEAAAGGRNTRQQRKLESAN